MATMAAETTTFIDTNILVQANVSSAPLHIEALNALRNLRLANNALWISRQILREYIATVTRSQNFMKPLDALTVAKRIRYFETRFSIADDNAAVTERLLHLLENVSVGGKQIHDANIVATMQVYGIQRLLTLNTADFTRFSSFITLLSVEDVLTSPEENSDE